ncbi:methionine--tRNA ligase [Persicimonas caeni]|uniref:Methionine--tRNA ligase n=1 Tax=Persicimonas caeni TaxID=2292766 RepID=A0A4Y6Q0D8_PERCE|nr:methionine--tRNA ligase [Persicimonas caeni]QDG53992.1 methionine--tRNA ligase [Persicimonas caeni]QED35213.1 methionine--tRNA ligase [Persicimonas caeni]
MANFYITTPIYYVNGAPHIGHAYTTIVADVFARHYRQRGDDVFFLTGTDEHGLKIQRAAEDRGIEPQELVDENSAKFRDLFEKLELSHDRFIRTTDADHKETVLEMIRRMKESGDIYLDTYEGWYSASDEAYYAEDEIEDGKAVATGSEVEWVEEASYFFKLSKYQDQLIEWYDSDTVPVRPKARRNEVRAFVDGGLKDLSISRTTFDWGIPFPDDPEHVLYVWVDALTNYLSGVGGFDEAGETGGFWPCDVHLIGKDILRFHAVYWPAFLLSAGVDLPKQVFAHGWWTVEGEKMSKSKGNWIDAFELADEYPLDLLRYFMVREIPLGSDGNFVQERIVERNNSELADNLGNLVNRTTKMVQSFIDGEVPAYTETQNEHDVALRKAADVILATVRDAMNKREPHNALDAIMSFAKDLNQYIQTTQPWKYNKEGDIERVQHILYHALEGIRWVAVLASAFVPDAAQKILGALQLTSDDDLQLASLKWGGLPAGNTVETPDVLFDKIDLEAIAKEEEQTKMVEKKQKKSKGKKGDSEKTGLVEFGDFMNIELRVGRIESAEKVEGADKLLKLSADVGEDNNRTIVAGLAKSWDPSDLEGKQVAMVTNLKPAKLFGIKSEAMVLAAETDEGKLELAFFSENVKPGTRIS